MAVNVGDVWEFAFISKVGPPVNQIGACRVHFEVATVVTGGPTDVEITHQADSVFASKFKDCVSATALYLHTEGQHVWPLPVRARVDDFTAAGACTGGANLGPTQNSGVISKHTALAGRPFRGRNYIPFPWPAAIDANGAPTGAYSSLLNLLCAKLDTVLTVTGALGSATLVQTIYHAKGYGRPPAFQHTTTRTVGTFASGRYGTQRRRGEYGRQN